MTEGDEPIAKDAYDAVADTYAVDVETNAYNAHIDFPGTTALVPDVAGKRVLDAGCGTGKYTEWLLDEGAEVVGVDVSDEMLAHASDRVDAMSDDAMSDGAMGDDTTGDNATGDDATGDDAADRVTLHRADIGQPLGFAANGAFDGVVSGLALGYVRDWRAVFDEFARVLDDGGFVVFSTGHPFDEFPLPETSNYFDVERRVKEWEVDVPYYRRPLSAVLNPVVDAGFRIDRIAEPQPTEAFREARPERYETESKRPVFLAVRALVE